MSTYHGLNVGDEVELEITQTARDGRGLARSKGLIIFVEGAIQGDKVIARIVKLGARYADAEFVKLQKKAAIAKARP